MATVELTAEQITDLSRPFIGLAQEIKEFFQIPENNRAYREWYRKKFGYEVNDEN